MKVLAIKQPWASLIAEGKKTIEVRSRPTNIRERVAIYASRSELDDNAVQSLSTIHLPKGYIVATAHMGDCGEYRTSSQFVRDADKHRIPLTPANIEMWLGSYAWCLYDIEKLEIPIPFKMPKGCVVWANYEGKL